MKKVTLLGDSIRLIGYGMKVPELLRDSAEVFQPADNCRFAKYTLRMLFDLKDEIAGSDVIHWNNGLWDVCDISGDGRNFTPRVEYLENVLRIAALLKRITPNVIFATTTPVRPENPYNDNAVIAEYNALVVPPLIDMGIKINDLNAAVSEDIPRYIRGDDLIHLTDDGIALCAKRVADAVKSLL